LSGSSGVDHRLDFDRWRPTGWLSEQQSEKSIHGHVPLGLSDGLTSRTLLLRETDLFDVTHDATGARVTTTAACGDGLHEEFMLKLEIGVDFDFEILCKGGSRAANDFENLAVQPFERGCVITQTCSPKRVHCKSAVVVGLESDFDRLNDRRRHNETGIARWSRRHVDGEITFRLDDFQSEHEEDQQQKDNIDHRGERPVGTSCSLGVPAKTHVRSPEGNRRADDKHAIERETI
jgi:hypothetical protein